MVLTGNVDYVCVFSVLTDDGTILTILTLSTYINVNNDEKEDHDHDYNILI